MHFKNKTIHMLFIILFIIVLIGINPIYANAKQLKIEQNIVLTPKILSAKDDIILDKTLVSATVKVKDGKVVLDSGFSDENKAFHHIIEKYKAIITFFSAMGAITMVGIFIYSFIKLGLSSGNPIERQKCITGLIITGIGTALLGSTALFVGLFYGAFK